MALTATATQGFERVGNVSRDMPLWVPGDPGDTFTKGDIVTFTVGEGIADPIAANEIPYGVVMETVVCPSALSAGFPVFGPATNPWGRVPEAGTNTLVQILPLVIEGTPIRRATFSDHFDDENITAYTAATPSITGAFGATGDGNNGALVYVYGGAGIGQWNVVADDDGAGLLTLHRVFDVALDATSDVIVLGGEAAASKGVGFFGRMTNKTAAKLDVSDGADDGHYLSFLSAQDVQEDMKNLRLPVIPAGSLLFV